MTTFERGWTKSGLREFCWWHRDSEFFAVHAPASEVTVDENGSIHTTIGLQCRVFPILRAVLRGVNCGSRSRVWAIIAWYRA